MKPGVNRKKAQFTILIISQKSVLGRPPPPQIPKYKHECSLISEETQTVCDPGSLSTCLMFIGLFENTSCLAPEDFGARGSFRSSYQKEERYPYPGKLSLGAAPLGTW